MGIHPHGKVMAADGRGAMPTVVAGDRPGGIPAAVAVGTTIAKPVGAVAAVRITTQAIGIVGKATARSKMDPGGVRQALLRKLPRLLLPRQVEARLEVLARQPRRRHLPKRPLLRKVHDLVQAVLR